MYKAIVWDLDGTLLDTLCDLAAAVNAALSMHGLPGHTVEEVRLAVGNGIRKLIERTVPAGTPEEITDRVFLSFKEYYKEHMNDTTAPYAGIPALLSDLSRAGVKMAIVSNKADFATKELACQHFADVIDVAVGEREGVRKKPAPDAVFAALSEMGVKPSEAVFIGDSEVDVETGRNAGMDTIAVTWGFRETAVLLAAGADRLARTPEELRKELM